MKVDKERLENTQPSHFTYLTENWQELDYYAFFPSVEPKGCVICIHGGGWTSDSAKGCFRKRRFLQNKAQLG